LWGLILVLALTSANARAQTSPAREAKRLKDLGAQALSQKKYREALDYFTKAYQIYPSPNLSFDIGLADEALERWPEAVDAFHSFLADAPGAPQAARDFALASLRRLEPLVGRVTIDVDPSDAAITVDGRPWSARALRVMPGRHTIGASKAGMRPAERDVDVRRGESQAVTLILMPAPLPSPEPFALRPPSPAPVAAAPSPLSPAATAKRTPVYKRWWPWTLLGVVVAGAAVGVAVGVTLAPAPKFNANLGTIGPGSQ
jgi:hypothetical protein